MLDAQSLAISIICLFMQYLVCDGCNSHTAQILTTSTPALSTTTSDLSLTPCSEDQWRIHECFNGGSCFAQTSRVDPDFVQLFCRCPSEYEGLLCQILRHPGVTEASLMHGSIAAGVVASVIVVLIVIVAFVVFKINKRKQEKKKNQPRHLNGTINQRDLEPPEEDGLMLTDIREGVSDPESSVNLF